MLDETDFRILDLLQKDGRITNADLADKVGLSASGCLRRLNQLEAEGYIDSYHAKLNPERVGVQLQAFLQITMRFNDTKRLAEFDSEASQWPEVLSIYQVTGQSDYLLHVATKDLKSFRALMIERLLAHPSVANVNSSIVITPIKQTMLLPLSG